MLSAREWIADQVAEILRPVVRELSLDTLRRLRVDVTIRFGWDDTP